MIAMDGKFHSSYEMFRNGKHFCCRNSLPQISLSVKNQPRKIKITPAFRIKLILPHMLNNFNKNLKKIAEFLFISMY